MTTTYILGIDPGPTPGLVGLTWRDGGGFHPFPDVVQCNHLLASGIIEMLVNFWPHAKVVIAVEPFVIGHRASRSGNAQAGKITRELVVELRSEWQDRPVGWIERPAGAVKPWATDKRLEAAGLLEPTVGMRHARDAARHALYAAVHDVGAPDPLSRKAKS